MDCIFCRIAKKEIPSTVVYEDDQVVAFRDINPQAPVHVLVIPRKHIPSLLEMADEDLILMGRMMKVISKLAGDLGLSADGFRVVNNCGPDAGQTVPHLHFHLLGGRELGWPPG